MFFQIVASIFKRASLTEEEKEENKISYSQLLMINQSKHGSHKNLVIH